VGGIVVLVLVFLVTIVGIIFVQEGSRRIPIVSAKRQVGGASTLASRQSYLPLKLNAGGVMPIIFASAVVFLPLTIANLTKSPWLIRVAGYLNPTSSTPWLYALVFFALICGFAFFYASLTVNPVDIATNLKRSGVAIPGVRPGSATADYLSGRANRLTLLGGLFLGASPSSPRPWKGHPGAHLPGSRGHLPADPGGRGDRHRQAGPDLRDLPALRRHWSASRPFSRFPFP
jgi:preprotein translocase subunit SecY